MTDALTLGQHEVETMSVGLAVFLRLLRVTGQRRR